MAPKGTDQVGSSFILSWLFAYISGSWNFFHQGAGLETLSSDVADSGLLVLETLGISEWSSIYNIAEKGGTLKAIALLRQFIGKLAFFEAQDRVDFDNATLLAQKIMRALTPELESDI